MCMHQPVSWIQYHIWTHIATPSKSIMMKQNFLWAHSSRILSGVVSWLDQLIICQSHLVLFCVISVFMLESFGFRDISLYASIEEFILGCVWWSGHEIIIIWAKKTQPLSCFAVFMRLSSTSHVYYSKLSTYTDSHRIYISLAGTHQKMGSSCCGIGSRVPPLLG